MHVCIVYMPACLPVFLSFCLSVGQSFGMFACFCLFVCNIRFYLKLFFIADPKLRVRRQNNSHCGNDNFPPSCPKADVRKHCYYRTKSCVYFRRCRSVNGRWQCDDVHEYDTFLCCKTICLSG